MKKVLKRIQASSLFQYCSSVKLAVPLMLVIGAVVSLGTFIESRYNADYAKLLVYNTVWFQTLLALLWLNIFCAALSRYPWKKHHTGFVITHLGLLTLLGGALLTKVYGIDGSLYVREGETSRTVFLPEKVIEVSNDYFFTKIKAPSTAKPLSEDHLSWVNKKLSPYIKIKKFYPFTEGGQGPSFSTEGDILSFNIKSPFFDQKVTLHSKELPERQMGPALFRWVTKTSPQQTTSQTKKQPHSLKSDMLIFQSPSGKVVEKVPLKKLPITIHGVKIELKKKYSHAVVVKNQITNENDQINPAIELRLTKEGKTYREILYSKFPGFSILKDSPLPFKLLYQAAGPNSPSPTQASETPLPKGPVVEFHTFPKKEVLFYKNGQLLKKQTFSLNQKIQMPWMNMILTPLYLGPMKDLKQQIRPISPTPKTDQLPPGAILVQAENQSFWLQEGQVKEITLQNGDPLQIYFGPNTIQLPFSVSLIKFYKKDYPGTQTAMSFESDVRINRTPQIIKISMNEPYKRDGYTLYQSSYDLGPPIVSIFSVNKDPGRPIKYLGSIILAIGIIIYIFMKSRFYKKWSSK
ncbi:MAG: hypothetical protein D6797_07425 [Bdellovibrio sp.]|nr:MAG: hypothetical protein D6797_07425 [Bdellovibrio sp.]